VPCDHAGLLLLFPALAELNLPQLVRQARYPSTRALSAWHSVGTLLLAKCARRARIHHIDSLTDDHGLAFALGLSALPKATHLGTYSWRVRRESNQTLLTELVKALRPLGLATGESGFNCDFHAIRHHGADTALEKHYVPRRSQRTRAVLTFFAQDHASSEMVYANADTTKAEQASRSSPSPTTGTPPPDPTPASSSSTPSSPPTRSSTNSPTAASPGSPCASAARASWPGSPRCPHHSGSRSPSPAPDGSRNPAGPACTKT
jgi:hypothetical protein